MAFGVGCGALGSGRAGAGAGGALFAIAGAGVGGATFGALALGVFGYIGTISTFIYQISQLLPGLVGVGLGKQPNGVAADISASLAKLAARLPGHAAERLRLASITAPVRVSGPVSAAGLASPGTAASPSPAHAASPVDGASLPVPASSGEASVPSGGISDAGITLEGRS